MAARVIRLRINRQIRVSPIRLVDAEGEQVGIVPLEGALKQADAAGLDLVEVSPTNRPPICKIIDYGKYKYDLKKKAKEVKAHSQKTELKEVRIGFRMGVHDMQTRARQAEKFLKVGNKVKVNLLFRGREMDYFDIAKAKIMEFVNSLADISEAENDPKKMGRSLSVMLKPLKKKK